MEDTLDVMTIERTALRRPTEVSDEHPRSISLTEVKWHQQLVDENSVRYGMELKYLN